MATARPVRAMDPYAEQCWAAGSCAGRVEPSDLRDGMTLEIRWIDATDRFGEYDLPSSVHPLHGAEGLGARISRHREAVNRRTIARWTRLSFCRSHGFAVLRRCV